jgi:hypothetical protein
VTGHTRRRRPYPPRRKPARTPFSATMWQRWLAGQPWATPSPDEQTVQLRNGIEEFRQRVVIGKEKPS